MKYGIGCFLFAFFVFFLTIPSIAGIYRFEDENGVIHFTNCPRDAKFKLYIKEKEDFKEEAKEAHLNTIPATLSLPMNSKDPSHYDQLIAECSKKYGVDFALIKAIIRAESGFNPYAVSRKGARGLSLRRWLAPSAFADEGGGG